MSPVSMFEVPSVYLNTSFLCRNLILERDTTLVSEYDGSDEYVDFQ
jgi:hypothetical protein